MARAKRGTRVRRTEERPRRQRKEKRLIRALDQEAELSVFSAGEDPEWILKDEEREERDQDRTSTGHEHR
jgi:hypothetical protein